MKGNKSYRQGFGDVWTDVAVAYHEGYYTSVTDYHEHDFYEINLILSGNVRILFGDRAEEGRERRMVLTRPGTPHHVSCSPDTLYRRVYLMFTDAFVADRLPEWQQLSAVFGEKGRAVTLTEEESARLLALIEQIDAEKSLFRRRLLVYCFLSLVTELSSFSEVGAGSGKQIPPYVVEVLAYLEKHYPEKILASDLARRMHVGRTTLMTEFKKYTGTTVGAYLTHCRLRNAATLLREGQTLEYTAERCGFSDGSGLVRSFRRCYGMTPRQYVEGDGDPSGV